MSSEPSGNLKSPSVSTSLPWGILIGVLVAGIVIGFVARGLIGQRPIARGYVSGINTRYFNPDDQPYGYVYDNFVILESARGGREILPFSHVQQLLLDQPVVVNPVRIDIPEAGSFAQ